MGTTTYQGSPCVTCGSSVRYRSNGCCRLCQLVRMRRSRLQLSDNLGRAPRACPTCSSYEWDMARDCCLECGVRNRLHVRDTRVSSRHDHIFAGKTCRKCGGVDRYVSNRQCVTCARAKQAQLREARQLRQQLRSFGRDSRGLPCKRCGGIWFHGRRLHSGCRNRAQVRWCDEPPVSLVYEVRRTLAGATKGMRWTVDWFLDREEDPHGRLVVAPRSVLTKLMGAPDDVRAAELQHYLDSTWRAVEALAASSTA